MQVFALGTDDEDKEVWFRTGITLSEPGGKTWQRVTLEEHPDVFNLNSPSHLTSHGSQPSVGSQDDSFSMSDCFSSSTRSGSVTHTQDTVSQVPMMALVGSNEKHVPNSGDIATVLPGTCDPKSVEISALHEAYTADFSQDAGGQTPGGLYLNGTVAGMEAGSQSRERSKSWQVIETSLQTSPEEQQHQPVEAEEALESLPSMSVVSAPGTTTVSPGDSASEPSAVKESVPMTALSVSAGSGDVKRTAESDLKTQEDICRSDCLEEGDSEAEAVERTTHTGAQPPVDMKNSNTETSLLGSSPIQSDTFDSLESGPSSDVICNFVTDLIDEDGEGDGGGDEGDMRKEDGGKQKRSEEELLDSGTVTFQVWGTFCYCEQQQQQ